MPIKYDEGGGDGAGRLCKGEDHTTHSLYNSKQHDDHSFPNILKKASYGNSIDVLSVPCSRLSLLFLSDADAWRNDSSRIGRDNEPPYSNLGRLFCSDSGQASCYPTDKGIRYAD